MDWTSIIVALITGLASFLAVYLSNRKSAKENLALINYRMDKAESRTADLAKEENKLDERTSALEKTAVSHEEKIKSLDTRVQGLETKLS